MDAVEQYGVTGFPCIVFVGASGKFFGGFVGGRFREDMMKAMQGALKNKEAFQTAETGVAKTSMDEPGCGTECFPILSYGK